MKFRAAWPAIAPVLGLTLLVLTACTDPNAPGAIPLDAPIDGIGGLEPSTTPDDWHSAPVPNEPDWLGIDIEALTINSEPYRVLDGADHYTNVGRIPEVRDPEWVKLLEDILAGERAKEFPETERAEASIQEYLDMTLEKPPTFDPTVTFTVELTPSSCTTEWSEDSGKRVDEGGNLIVLEPSIFIAKSKHATEGLPLSCSAADFLNAGQGASASAWFIDPEFSDGKYFIIAAVDGSRYRQVTPVTISGPTIPHGCRGICNNEAEVAWQEAITYETSFGEYGDRISKGVVSESDVKYLYDNGAWAEPPGSAAAYPELVIGEALKTEKQWWVEPESKAYFTVSDVEVTGSGTNNAPVSGSFTVALGGEHRTTNPSTWVLGREQDAQSGPALGCSEGYAEGHEILYDCSIPGFVDSRGKADAYLLILTSQPGDVRQVVELPVE